ncbi:SMEK domain-containing protein [Vibrio scophthalmi]|uniref:SMEK domain-containing protein n=1 Tax=Vibrio scophthalmi TaxID=45658 RepID=A0A1C7F923_9VIBR|nr:SMEK domain-containing protein [Vibrio scophthalmi]ANU36257.1 hypothetical protein VSVS05_01130 [Vibrio scophthalmi]
MIYDRIDILNKITRTLSILMCDIKLHQSMNDFSINIHAEDFFKGVLNRLYGSNYSNANASGKNEAYIDLVDHTARKAIQVTSTTTKHKIDNSLKVLDNPAYNNYSLSILYLLEKPTKFTQSTIDEYKIKYSINDIHSHLKDSTDLLDDIKQLDDHPLLELYNNHFSSIEEKYTDEIALQIIFELLLHARHTYNPNYDDDLGSIDTPEKIVLNNLNVRIAAHINLGLDYTQSIYNFDDHNQIQELRNLVVDGYYANVLRNSLKRYEHPSKLQAMNVPELHLLAKQSEICFNKVLFSLQECIESAIIKVNFNSQSVSWIIIAYFFEICDVGVKE